MSMSTVNADDEDNEQANKSTDEQQKVFNLLNPNPFNTNQQMASSIISSSGSSSFSTSSSSSSSFSVQSKNAITEKVSTLAAALYRELEQLINHHGEHDFKMIMSLIISTLESLDVTTHERDELESEVELLKEDREQLLTQWERERDLRKKSEEKSLQVEDLYEERIKHHDENLKKCQHALKVAEMKLKNSTDQVSRFDERELEYKRNYTKLNERYNQLMKLHCENTEKLRLYHSFASDSSSSFGTNRHKVQLSNLNECYNYLDTSVSSRELVNDNSLSNDISNTAFAFLSNSKSLAANTRNQYLDTSILDSQFEEFDFAEERNSDEDTELCSIADETDLVGDSGIKSSFFGMTKEVEKLINENNDLMATKNALNVIKDDLLEQINELSGKLRMVESDMKNLEDCLTYKDHRILELEAELKSERIAKNQLESDRYDDNLSFSRSDITRLITEKNQYKQKFLDLEDAVKWQEMMRSYKNKGHSNKDPFTRKRTQIFNLFSSLFGSSLLTTVSFVETNRSSPSKSNILQMESPPIVDNYKEDKIVRNNWLIPKYYQANLPLFINRTFLPNTIENVRCHVNISSCQMWVAATSSSNPQHTRLLSMDASHDNLSSAGDFFQTLHDLKFSYIVSSMCHVLFTPKFNEFYKQCEFCKRDLKMNIDILDDGYHFESDSILLGTQDGQILAFSTDLSSREALFAIKINTSILTMKYNRGKVACGLANGSVLFLHSDESDLWFRRKHTISLCVCDENIRALCFLPDGKLWAGMRNQIACIDQFFTVEKIFKVHPRRTSQIRHIVNLKELVIIAMRLDSTLRVFNSLNQEHIQDIDLDPLERTIIGVGRKSGLSLVKVTALIIGLDGKLYAGTSNGSIICISMGSYINASDGMESNRHKNKRITDHIAIISTHGHKKDVQCLCSFKLDACKLLCSIGSGYNIHESNGQQHINRDSVNAVNSKSICFLTWKLT